MAAAVVAAKKADAFPTAQKFALVSTAVFAMQMLNVPIGAGVSGHVIGGVFAAPQEKILQFVGAGVI